MTALLHEPLFTGWDWLWEGFESPDSRDESLDSLDFSTSLTIEQMLRSSIPTERLEQLREIWKSLPHCQGKLSEKHTMRWNLGLRMADSNYDIKYDPEEFLREINSTHEDASDGNTSDVGLEPTDIQKQQAKLFLHELMLITLATLCNFANSSSVHMSNLPSQVSRFLRCHAIEMTSIVIMCELS